MVLDIAFCNTFLHSFLSEKGIFLGHPCVEGDGSCCTEEVFSGFLPSHLPWVFLHVTSVGWCWWEGLKGSEAEDTPFSTLQLWESVHEGTLSPLLAVLHMTGFSLTPLSHIPYPHGEAGKAWLWTSLPSWVFVRLAIPTNFPHPNFQFSNSFFKAWNRNRGSLNIIGISFGFSESRISAQHQNWEAINKGSLVWTGKTWGWVWSCKLSQNSMLELWRWWMAFEFLISEY